MSVNALIASASTDQRSGTCSMWAVTSRPVVNGNPHLDGVGYDRADAVLSAGLLEEDLIATHTYQINRVQIQWTTDIDS